MPDKLQITFLPSNKIINVIPGTTVLKAAETAGIPISSPCGGNGICGKCRVKKISGKLVNGQVTEDIYLACQAEIFSDCEIEVIAAAEVADDRILKRGKFRPLEINPNVQQFQLNLTQPAITDQRADFERIRDEIQQRIGAKIDLASHLLPHLPHKIRKCDFKINTIILNKQLVEIVPGVAPMKIYGIAFDIGTTTVAGLLVDLESGDIIASSARTNPQAAHGDDVVSRIDFSTKDSGRQKLASEIRTCLNAMIIELCQQTNVDWNHIFEITIAGNTTMTHLLLEIPGEAIAQAPYVPAFRSGIEIKGSAIELAAHPEANVRVLPNIAGFVGADTSAAILASGMHADEKLQLLVDIGTNGEIVLGNKDRLIACSTAAGPAFEGARLKHGMRGERGAIEKVSFADDVLLSVIGNEAPRGICGSGVIDLIAEFIRSGVVDKIGRILAPSKIHEDLPDKIRMRLEEGARRWHFVLANSDSGAKIVFTQRDIQEVQLAKAAIFSGIRVLLKAFSITANDLDKILIAGAFGNYIRPRQAKQIGLLPNLPDEKFDFIGNAAIEGALRVLLSTKERKIIEEISDKTEYIELSGRADFQEFYVMAMMFDDV